MKRLLSSKQLGAREQQEHPHRKFHQPYHLMTRLLHSKQSRDQQQRQQEQQQQEHTLLLILNPGLVVVVPPED